MADPCAPCSLGRTQTLSLILTLTLPVPLTSLENFDELAVKQRLLEEMGGGPGGRYPELTIADISLEVSPLP